MTLMSKEEEVVVYGHGSLALMPEVLHLVTESVVFLVWQDQLPVQSSAASELLCGLCLQKDMKSQQPLTIMIL